MNNNDSKMDNDFLRFVSKYWGIIIGALIGIIIAFTALYKFVIYAIVIVASSWCGYYIQNHKSKIKEVLRNLVERM